jgi:uncharacterized LabA/DUF88 family protein
METKNDEKQNLAFVDGQNLYMGTAKHTKPWKIDLVRFRRYLEKKYHVTRAYYFLGCVNEDHRDLYDSVQEAGFIIHFREHSTVMLGKKKGNVDSDIVFSIMKKMYHKEDFDNIVLVSGDGDYKMLVDFLIEEKKFEKILFPNKEFASSLYKKIGAQYFDHLDTPDIKKKIELK